MRTATDEYIGLPEAARRLGYSMEWLRRRLKSRGTQLHVIGRDRRYRFISRDDFEALERSLGEFTPLRS